MYDYYTLCSRISYTKGGLKPKHASKDDSEFAEAISLNDQYILYALKYNAIHQFSKPEDPSTVLNPHRFGLPLASLVGIDGKRKKLLTST
jgi:hypothetical protein